ncbi:hypothetical protein GYMLUDRAFT_155616 [Collybiopsis luxurians FD-317 M1]|nr:hypothetical protein GYMLUDRAFT_155616 [Collybiopsis luxurians FD-317 M1]
MISSSPSESDLTASEDDDDQSESSSDEEVSSKPLSKPQQPKSIFPPPSPLDLELIGIIIETMSMSRSSSHLASALYRTVRETRSGVAGLSEVDIMWVSEFERVMKEAASRFGMFGMVESSFRNDPRDCPLPFSSRFFYVPDRDPDTERAQLIKLTMPGAGKRSETKKYKQYYWKPVGK